MNLKNLPRFLHGGDYNPEQWLDNPEILVQDMKFMEEAHINTITVGVFSWSTLEPKEGEYHFEWLDKVFDEMEKRGGYVILATPSGGRPRWLSEKYNEVNRVDAYGHRHHHGFRHNHCFSSPIYREKVKNINTLLARRYKARKSLILWYISNEYSGECFCENCQKKWRSWLKNKYKSLEALNKAWYTTFWSGTYSSWSQVEAPMPLGENKIHAMDLDWKRFCTDMTIDFFNHEVQSVKKITPHIPVTTNFMAEGYDTHDFIPLEGIDYARFSKYVDIVSYDSYPHWHNNYESLCQTAMKSAFVHDIYYSLKHQPFLIMESTPSLVNSLFLSKAKRPGMHILSSFQQIAHGSQSTLYFQIRQSYGNSEKYHGAVIGHDNSSQNRVFQEVKKYGELLEKIEEIKSTTRNSKIAILIDWESLWALKRDNAYCRQNKRYFQTLQEHYQYFWDNDIAIDFVTIDDYFNAYDILIAPMLYMFHNNVLEKLKNFVSQNKILVTTYFTGKVDENDQVFIGKKQKELEELLGLRILELDNSYDDEFNEVIYHNHVYQTKQYQEIIELYQAKALAYYQKDFYKNTPAITYHKYHQGHVYYMAARFHKDCLHDFYESIACKYKQKLIKSDEEVSVQVRLNERYEYYFIMNFSNQSKTVIVNQEGYDMLEQKNVNQNIILSPYHVKIIRLEKTKNC